MTTEIKNLDGVGIKPRKHHYNFATPPNISVRTTTAVAVKKNIPPIKHTHIYFSQYTRNIAMLLLLVFTFCTGAYAMWQTGSIRALTKTASSAQDGTPPGSIPLVADNFSLGPVNSIPNDKLFSMTLEQLEYYLQEGYKSPETRQKETEARIHAARTKGLAEYLKSKKSPLISIADTLADLKHWRLVLAIANSESSLGKHCSSNNCSGIGVAPGHPLWQEYATKADWAKALDRLIEKRYKGWTLEDMNGVYNKPGSDNWIFAAKQVLTDLQNIE